MAAGTIYPDFPGKGAEKGWYRYNDSDRYWTGSEFRYSGEGRYNVAAHLGGFLTRDRSLSPEAQARSDAQQRFNDGTATDADRALLRGNRGSSSNSSNSSSEPTETPEFPTTAVTRTIAPSRDYQAEAQAKGQTSTGRQSKRTSPTGVEQTGTQTGIKPMTIDDVNSALGRIGSNTISNPYSSNNLPATPDYEVPNTGGETPKQYSAEDILVAGYRMGGGDDTGAMQIAAGFNMGGGNDANKGAVPIDSNLAKGIAAGKEVDTGATPDQTSGLAGALSDKAGMRFTAPKEMGEGAKYAPPTVIDSAEIQRRRSFLDAKDSMTGLRNIEADQGIYVAGGKYHHVNPNAGKEGQNDFIEISKEQRDGIMRGGEGAEQLRKSFVDRINNKGDDAPAAPEVSEKFADAPQILENPVRQGGDNTAYFQTPTGSTVESSTDFTDPPKVDMNGMEDYRKLAGKVNANPYLR